MQLQSSVATGDSRIEGTLTDGDREFVFTLTRTGFDSSNPVEESLQGRYTMLIIGNEDLGKNYPHGHGAALVTVNSSGKVRAAGTLGDGTRFSQSAPLSRDLEWQLMKFLYRTKPKGFISGKLTFRDLPGISDFDGKLQWKKYPHSRERYFAHGFDLTAQALGSKFVALASDEFAMPGLVDSTDNAEFFTNDAGIFAPAPSEIDFTWGRNNKLTFNRLGTETVRLSVSRTTGALSGTYLGPDQLGFGKSQRRRLSEAGTQRRRQQQRCHDRFRFDHSQSPLPSRIHNMHHFAKLLVIFAVLFSATANAEPLVESWFTELSGRYARIYPTLADQDAGNAVTTWSRGQGTQSLPTYAGVSEISVTATDVYIRTTNLGFHIMGPWYGDEAKQNLFPQLPRQSSRDLSLSTRPRHAAGKQKRLPVSE